MIGDDDWSVFMDPSGFAEPASYAAAGHPVLTVHGIFAAAHAHILGGAHEGVSTVKPVLAIAATALPFEPVDGDIVTIRGATWRVADPQPDGAGLIRLLLERT